MIDDPSLHKRLIRYLNVLLPGATVNDALGCGTDGAVWSTSRGTAIKVFRRESGYLNERDAYRRLAAFGVVDWLAGFRVPEMVGSDDRLMVVEMDLMQTPPYIVDFAKVRIDRSPEFSTETIAENERQGRELFDDRWPQVRALLEALESYQIYYLDPKPQNIVLP